MYGLTDRQPAELTSLNRAWNFASVVTDTNGCVPLGYEKRERAFKFVKTGAVVSLKLQANQEQPLENPAFVIANWDSPNANISLKLNGETKTRGKDFARVLRWPRMELLRSWFSYRFPPQK
jgi:hypothetical protein